MHAKRDSILLGITSNKLNLKLYKCKNITSAPEKPAKRDSNFKQQLLIKMAAAKQT